MTGGFSVREVLWKEDAGRLRLVRYRVFVEEQGVAEEEEWDGMDEECRHLVAEDAEGRPIGTARLTPDGRVGRMAVLQQWRRRGVGSALLEAAVGLAGRLGFRTLSAHAQVQAAGFYARRGFRAQGEIFLEAGIPHRKMVLKLVDPVYR